jgi:pimeloyl-ACP methyl ester carboxylesterase
MSSTPVAIMLDAWSGPPVAGLLFPTDSNFSILFLHDVGGDLDNVSALINGTVLADIRRIALDLPGHGLSGYCQQSEQDAWLDRSLSILSDRGFAPFVIVSLGSSIEFVYRLAKGAPICGLVAIAPRAAIDTEAPQLRGIPLLAFISGLEAEADENWQRLRDLAGLPWTAISLPLPSVALVSPVATVAGTIASHISGFARESHLLKPIRPSDSGHR